MPIVTIETDLTQDEIANLGRELARAETAKGKALVEKKIAMDGFKGRLDGLESRITELTQSIETGKAPTEMEVEERPGAPGVVEYYRPGTNEKVGERPMSFSDRQQGLNFPDGDDRDDDEPPAEEQEVAGSPSEAEMLREARLDFEHKERVAALVAEVSPLVVVTPLDGGGFLAALDISGESLRDTGDTEEAARAHVLELFANAQPKTVPMPDTVTWGDVAEASAEIASEETAATPGLTKPPKTGLKAPKGKKRKGGVVLVGADGEETPVTEESIAEGAPTAPAVPAETCLEDCAIEHQHTAERVAF